MVPVHFSEKGLESEMVFRQLLDWTCSGVIGGVVRGEEVFPVGAGGTHVGGYWDGFEEREQRDPEVQLLSRGSVKHFRALLLFAVAQAVADGATESPQLRDWDPEDVPPEGVSDPRELADWALRRAAVRLTERTKGDPNPKGSDACSVFFVYERAKDPEGRCDVKGRLCDWAPDEVEEFRRVYGLSEVVFDQGCLGLPCTTSLLTSSWCLYETLHAVRVTEDMKGFLQGLADLRKLTGQREASGWFLGLCRVVQGAWRQWTRELDQFEVVRERRLLLAKLAEAEAQARHEAQDHVPYRRGCPVCVSAQGRQRSHWRSGFPDLHSISVDIAGPFVKGQSYNVEASGRDKGHGYRYMLACTYAVPDKFGRADKGSGELDEYVPSDCEPLVPVQDSVTAGSGGENSSDLLADLWDLPEPGEDLGIKAVTHRVRKKGPEGDDSREPGLEDGPTKSKHLTLFIGIPLRSKKGREVYPQVQGVINKLEAAGFPVHRYHSDRAKELRSDAVMRWIKERGIHPSSTAGESPAGNRAEIAVQQLKGMVRKLLGASRLDKQFWPLALMHASTRFWIRFNETLGIGQPNLLPFGMRIMARKRMRSGYETQWESRTQEGVYVGHAPSTPGGHLVLLPSEGGHKVLLTNTVYPLRAETALAPNPNTG